VLVVVESGPKNEAAFENSRPRRQFKTSYRSGDAVTWRPEVLLERPTRVRVFPTTDRQWRRVGRETRSTNCFRENERSNLDQRVGTPPAGHDHHVEVTVEYLEALFGFFLTALRNAFRHSSISSVDTSSVCVFFICGFALRDFISLSSREDAPTVRRIDTLQYATSVPETAKCLSQ
jgi:hypothetical protein